MNLKIKNEIGVVIEIDPETVDSVEDIGCEEHCVLHIGAIPVKVEGIAQDLAWAIERTPPRHTKVPVKAFVPPEPEKPAENQEAGLPTESGENIPPPAVEEAVTLEPGLPTESGENIPPPAVEEAVTLEPTPGTEGAA